MEDVEMAMNNGWTKSGDGWTEVWRKDGFIRGSL